LASCFSSFTYCTSCSGCSGRSMSNKRFVLHTSSWSFWAICNNIRRECLGHQDTLLCASDMRTCPTDPDVNGLYIHQGGWRNHSI
jgi:hypothetical protein